MQEEGAGGVALGHERPDLVGDVLGVHRLIAVGEAGATGGVALGHVRRVAEEAAGAGEHGVVAGVGEALGEQGQRV